MTDEEHYNAMAESMKEDASSNPSPDVELPKVESPHDIAARIIGLYKEKYS